MEIGGVVRAVVDAADRVQGGDEGSYRALWLAIERLRPHVDHACGPRPLIEYVNPGVDMRQWE